MSWSHNLGLFGWVNELPIKYNLHYMDSMDASEPVLHTCVELIRYLIDSSAGNLNIVLQLMKFYS